MNSQKNILFLGGNGFIGRNAIAEIQKLNKYKIFVLTRQIPLKSSPNELIEFVQGDILNIESLKNVLKTQKINIIIQSVQFKGHPVERPWLGKEYTYHGLDAAGTENLMQAISETQQAENIEQIIYLSGAGAGQANSNYSWTQAKHRAEKAIIDSKINYTILRPSWVYGKGDQSMSKFVLFAKYLPFFPLIGNGSAPVNPIWVEDLAKIIANSLESKVALNQIINIGSLPELNMKEVAKIVLQAVNGKVNKPIIPHPKPLMKLIGTFAQFLSFSPLSPNSVEFLTMDIRLKDLKEEILDCRIHSLEKGLSLSGLI